MYVIKATVAFLTILYASGNFIDYNLEKLQNIYADSLLKKADECVAKQGRSQVLSLLFYITETYLKGCVNVIFYEKEYELESKDLNFDLKTFLTDFPEGYVHGQINRRLKYEKSLLEPIENRCRNYLYLLTDVKNAEKLVFNQTVSKVIIVTSSTRWRIEEYLESFPARKIVNLLVISNAGATAFLLKSEEESNRKRDVNMYTHDLYVDGVGSSAPRFLTAWRCAKLTREMNLFPPKMKKGFNGRQFVVTASEEPPFTVKKKMQLNDDSNNSQLWDGIEIRLLRLLAAFLNYTIDINEPKQLLALTKGASEVVISEVLSGKSEIGLGGTYITSERLQDVTFSIPHSIDCAAFVTRTSTALPRYRAILGPFQWTVWLALTITYMIAILPLTFADSHSLRPLLKNPWQLENMFWYVFGTFTNLFTFYGEKSWTQTKKYASRLLIGWYWVFTIIVTACYTGSIVSFITLYVFPDVIDHVDQLAAQNFRIGSLSTGGWGKWFNESEHEATKWMLRDIELIPNTTQGLKNVTNSFYLPMFRPYAFLAGRAQLEYMVRTNYTAKRKKEMLHITKDCFVPFGVSMVFPRHAVYADQFNLYILRAQQSGIVAKLLNEFQWEVERLLSSGNLIQASSGSPLRTAMPTDRKLTLDDMQGMYLLMGAGYLIALVILIIEGTHVSVANRRKVSFKERVLRLRFWKSDKFKNRVELIPATIMAIVERLQEPPEVLKEHDHYSGFKKYDSRIINSYPIRNDSWKQSQIPVYFSEFKLNEGGLEVIRESKSLPNIKGECRYRFTSNSCTNLNSNGSVSSLRESSECLKFGSINSLPWDVGQVVRLQANLDQDRAQST